jgi:LacI family transcriptional regulator
MDHLWNLGHRSIVCVADERIAEGPLRARLYEEFLRDHGAGDAARVYYTTQPDPEPSYRLGRELLATLDRPGGPTAIYTVSDTLAIGLLQAAFQLGIPVPKRLSIVGFDDIDIASFTIPPLTTVNQAGEEMGRIAAELILAMVAGDRQSSEVDDVILEPKLVVRQSTAPLPA